MVPTHGKPYSIITIKDKENTHALKIPKDATGSRPVRLRIPTRRLGAKHQSAKPSLYTPAGRTPDFAATGNRRPWTKPSLYIPAGRTGTIEILHIHTQLQNHLSDILTSMENSESIDEHSLFSLTQKLLEATRLDTVKQDFYNMVLDAYSNGSIECLQDRFYALFSRHVHVEKQGAYTVVEGVHGFRTPLENTGSGMISSLPILLGIDHVKEGGSLIIEEPEAHMEPDKQFAMMEELWKVSEAKNLSLILTTHSDYVLKKLLSMVSQGKMNPSELGLYYFKRYRGQYTKILEMPVDETGEAEQPLFQEALDTMIGEFSK